MSALAPLHSNPLYAYKIKLFKITFLNFEAELNNFLDALHQLIQ